MGAPDDDQPFADTELTKAILQNIHFEQKARVPPLFGDALAQQNVQRAGACVEIWSPTRSPFLFDKFG
jgi:hypothetical protein